MPCTSFAQTQTLAATPKNRGQCKKQRLTKEKKANAQNGTFFCQRTDTVPTEKLILTD
jgi:hypothetical protein